LRGDGGLGGGGDEGGYEREVWGMSLKRERGGEYARSSSRVCTSSSMRSSCALHSCSSLPFSLLSLAPCAIGLSLRARVRE